MSELSGLVIAAHVPQPNVQADAPKLDAVPAAAGLAQVGPLGAGWRRHPPRMLPHSA